MMELGPACGHRRDVSDAVDMTEADDGELWRRAVNGEPECFGVLFDRHAETVRAFCARRTGELDAADDLVSIVFLEAWRRRGDVELVDGNALPWLYGVARRSIQHRWRTAVRHRRALARIPAAAAAADHADEVAARIDDERHLVRLRQTLARLRPAERDVIVLCVWQQLSYADAAVALGVPVGTVRSRLSRARARLDALTGIPDPLTFPTPRQELS
jgi:RNA polymerase sigma factor (sigma-70 family)